MREKWSDMLTSTKALFLLSTVESVENLFDRSQLSGFNYEVGPNIDLAMKKLEGFDSGLVFIELASNSSEVEKVAIRFSELLLFKNLDLILFFSERPTENDLFKFTSLGFSKFLYRSEITEFIKKSLTETA